MRVKTISDLILTKRTPQRNRYFGFHKNFLDQKADFIDQRIFLFIEDNVPFVDRIGLLVYLFGGCDKRVVYLFYAYK